MRRYLQTVSLDFCAFPPSGQVAQFFIFSLFISATTAEVAQKVQQDLFVFANQTTICVYLFNTAFAIIFVYKGRVKYPTALACMFTFLGGDNNEQSNFSS
jgi:hypothetical protein